jgi:hypothetical protein
MANTCGYVIVLDESISREESDKLLGAISCLKGVHLVEEVEADIHFQIALQKARKVVFDSIKEILHGRQTSGGL